MIPPETVALCGAALFVAFVVSRRADAFRRPFRAACYRSPESAERARGAFARLSRADDLKYLRRTGCSPALAARLRSERRRISQTYLRQARGEFAATAARARAASAVADSPQVAMRVLKASLAFEALCLLLRLELWAGAWLPLRVDVSALTRRLRALQVPTGAAQAEPATSR